MRCLILVMLCGLAPAQGAVEVTVKWEGDVPERKAVVIPDDFAERHPEEAAFCGHCAKTGQLFDESLVVDPASRGVRDVAVTLEGLDAGGRAPEPGVLDNAGCRFEPHMQFVPVGKRLGVKNSDTFTHNARITGRGGRQLWNALVPAEETVETYPLPAAGVYTVYCDVHPWMRAYVVATRNPWVGVTDKDGRTKIEGLPVGQKADVRLWHPTLGRARVGLAVLEGKTTKKTLTQKDFQRR